MGILLSAVAGRLGLVRLLDAPAAVRPDDAKGYWQSALKDEDKGLLVTTPTPTPVEPIHSVYLHKFYRGDPSKKQVALTFDDGPHPAWTPKLLAVLKKYHVKATFFVVGMRAEKNPELIRQEVADGHCIANHTYHHNRLAKDPVAMVSAEIQQCSAVIKQITGKAPRFFRPPGGTFDTQVTDTVDSLGYLTVLWTVNTGDFERPTAQVIEDRALRGVRNGAIFLFHDGVPQTIEALPEIITKLRAQGYEFVTIDEMVDQR
jgi:peptidoglycan/xylan/chitin deacetylase (PgdA/CDA1 family)